MSQAEVVNRILFEFETMTEEEIIGLIKPMPPKIIRWLAIHHPDNRIRKIFFRETNVEIGEGTVINQNLVISDDYKPLVRFGQRVAVAPNVTIIASSWPNNSALSEHPYVAANLIKTKPVTIEDDAWIGANVTILPGVRIGRGAVIGVGAVITEDVAPFTVVAGVPARVIRNLAE